ncbi:MAG: type IV pilus assembly protein PilY1 [Desulfobacteraceae bacterium Eth-SRB2]|nr:MAG: type IV pilus assembly protein PilY1 [Desulfobacteraceae bacterium Eth-SRB2]
MKRMKYYNLTIRLVIFSLIFMANPGVADDTCVFSVTADDVPPNIVLLLDNGAEMEQAIWHSAYDNSTDYTPSVPWILDVVPNGAAGNGFFNPNGYGITSHGGGYYLVRILDTLLLDSYDNGLIADSSDSGLQEGTWTINGRTITLPAEPATTEVDGVIDNASNIRYSKNYLNWLFFAQSAGGSPLYDGSALQHKTRFYYAKKAIMTVSKLASNQAKFGIYNFANDEGASSVQPLGMVVNTPLAPLPADNTLDSAFVNNVNTMGTVTYSPLAEGLATVGGYYASASSHVVGAYCQKSFIIIVTPGVSSEDQGVNGPSYQPNQFSDADDGDDGGIGEGNIKADSTTYNIPVNQNGSTQLDDVAHYLYTHDIPQYSGAEGFQNVSTYTVGFMGDQISNLFLTNTSNNGNGNKNLYDTSDEEYGKYHFTAEEPDTLSGKLLAAVNDILSKTSTFTAPVVPVTRTTSGNRIYMAFFKPGEENFWEGNVTKFGLSNDNEIIGADIKPATWPNGAMKDGAVPYWATIDWANDDRSPDPTTNGIRYENRNIYTYLGNTALTDASNAFKSTNINITAAMLGNPTDITVNGNTVTGKDKVIYYVRGADVFDEDSDFNTIGVATGDTAENRAIITGDILHSEPKVVRYNDSTTMVYFGANDGMLHAVLDSDGTEAWAFIPPDQLHRLKDMVEGTGHQYYVDSSPKAYITDVNKNGEVDGIDQVILVCGERKGGTGYFALDVTDPTAPKFEWRINQYDDATAGTVPAAAAPMVISQLGETWSEPQFGLVKTASGVDTNVLFVGGGYSSDNSKGKTVLAIDVITGAVVKQFTSGMTYSFPSTVSVIDEDGDGYVDKVYAGDLGGQVWRFANFNNPDDGSALTFPQCNEIIDHASYPWTGQVFFKADDRGINSRNFFYPPSVTLEKGYDLVFMGTGDRENACCNNVPPTECSSSEPNILCAVKDTHSSGTIIGERDVAGILYPKELVDLTDPSDTPPNLGDPTSDADGNGFYDKGWYIRLVDDSNSAVGEKVLAESTVFYKVFYITTFTPNDDPCMPGGEGKLYALSYLTAGAVMDFDNDDANDRSVILGGGIPSKPVMVIRDGGDTNLLISVGSTNPDDESEDVAAGVLVIDPVVPKINFFYLWWRELFN